jgi:hypothetical protein
MNACTWHASLRSLAMQLSSVNCELFAASVYWVDAQRGGIYFNLFALPLLEENECFVYRDVWHSDDFCSRMVKLLVNRHSVTLLVHERVLHGAQNK